jgi:hypothetical protein
MAYIFELETDFSPPIKIGDDYVLDFALGYKLDTSEIVTMSVMLVAGDSYLDEPLDKLAPLENAIYDLQFGIRVHNAHNGNVSEPDFTIETSRKYIPDHARSQVAAVLRNAIARIVGHVHPYSVTMETFYPNLPDKALRKYQAISAAIEECGYKVADAFRDGTNGTNYWFYTRE